MFARRPRRSLLAFTASLHLFFALTSLAFAETPQCKGIDLLAKMKREDPQGYKGILAESREIPNGKAIFWKIEKKRTRPSYLLGTMHVNDRRVVNLPAAVKKRYLRADVVILESIVADMGKAVALTLTKPDIMTMPRGQKLQDFLSANDKQIIEPALKAKGLSLFAVDYLRPWVISIAFPPATCFATGAKKDAAWLDQQILNDAVARGVKVEGLESFEEQRAAFAGMSMESQVKALVESVTADSRTQDIFETMVSIYKSGNPGLLKPFLSRHSSDISLTGSGAASEFEINVLIKRNHRMAERSVPYLATGNAFIAVGALHLSGKEGLVELFRQQGYKVSPVE